MALLGFRRSERESAVDKTKPKFQGKQEENLRSPRNGRSAAALQGRRHMATRISEDFQVYRRAEPLLRAYGKPGPRPEAVSAARSLAAHALMGFLKARGYEGLIPFVADHDWNCGVSLEHAKMAAEFGAAVSGSDLFDAAFLIGSFYTELLPEDYRQSLGVYYTPRAVAEMLLDMLEESGVDWTDVRVLDPGCGGAAFLLPVAQRMVQVLRSEDIPVSVALPRVLRQIRGIDIDPFAATFTRAVLALYAREQGCGWNALDLISAVVTGDALDLCFSPQWAGAFSVVVGNPPYGKVTLSADRRRRFARSLWGHANLYGLFMDAAVRFLQDSGWVGFVTPASFLGGEYFKCLRALLLEEAPLERVAFIGDRRRIFRGVLQETCLAVFRRRGDEKPGAGTVTVYSVDSGKLGARMPVGSFSVSVASSRKGKEEAWFLPRSGEDVPIALAAARQPCRLRDYGYRVFTGQLVWNRHKTQICGQMCAECYPLIWAEAVRAGHFDFNYTRRQKAFVRIPEEKRPVLVIRQPVVLVQRTTAKEQKRRITAAVVDDDFVKHWGGFVVENHLNVIAPDTKAPALHLDALAALLNTQTVDKVFRCLNGSAAVSRFELESLPLPVPDAVQELNRICVGSGLPDAEVELLVQKAYGLGA